MVDAAMYGYRLLLVEDDAIERDLLTEMLEVEGIVIRVANSGEEALFHLSNTRSYDLIILDLMLPGMNGFRFLSALRVTGSQTPVLVLSARSEQHSILEAFELGVVDYVIKPYNPEELLARIRAILRRTKPSAETPMDILRLGDIEVNFSSSQAWRNGDKISLTRYEIELLEYLTKARGKCCTRKDILRNVWGIAEGANTRTVDRHIASLRQKIEPDPHHPKFIETIYGNGYRLQNDI